MLTVVTIHHTDSELTRLPTYQSTHVHDPPPCLASHLISVSASVTVCACHSSQVATDIAARGLDIPDVQLVLQNGLPSNKEFYVHRAGRTARAGKAGRCVVLYKDKERQDVGALGRELRVQFSFQAPPPVNVGEARTQHQPSHTNTARAELCTATLYQMHF